MENILNIKKNVKFIKADISKKGLWVNHFKGVKYVFHLAALDIVPSIDNPVKYYNSNVTGTLNVLEACKRHKITKLIYAASSSCYGIPKNTLPKKTRK